MNLEVVGKGRFETKCMDQRTHSAGWQLLKLGGRDARKECRDSDSEGLHCGEVLLNAQLRDGLEVRFLWLKDVCSELRETECFKGRRRPFQLSSSNVRA